MHHNPRPSLLLQTRDDHRSSILHIYEWKNASDLCLHLQDEFGVDIVLMLHILYIAHFVTLVPSSDYVSKVDHDVEAWRTNVIEPLRSMRRYLKPHVAPGAENINALYNTIKLAELDAELAAVDTMYDALVKAYASGLAWGSAGTATAVLANHYAADPSRFTEIDRVAATVARATRDHLKK